MAQVQIHAGDNRQSLRRLIDSGLRVHSVVTDPPYGLVSVQKRFGKDGAAAARTEGNDGSFSRLSGGFMGKSWDATEIERDPDFWKLIYEILLPGGYVFAFSGSRTGHWQACAMEQAGFVMHPMHGWVFGSGFPKAHNASAAIEKMRLGDVEPTRRICRFIRSAMDAKAMKSRDLTQHFGNCNPRLIDHWAARDTDSQPSLPTAEQWGKLKEVLSLSDELDAEFRRLDARKGEFGEAYNLREIVGTVDEWNNRTNYALSSRDGLRRGSATTAEAAQWEGWAYGTQAQKPALEPIYLGQKPFSEKTGAANLLKHGVGAVNIDGCRVPVNSSDSGQLRTMQRGDRKDDGWGMGATTDAPVVRPEGRYPANLMHDGSPDVVALFPDSKGQQGAVRGDEPSGVTKDVYGTFNGRVPAPVRGDSGSAARFFHAFPPDADPIIYHAKARKADRAGSAHPTVKPVALMQYLIRHITPSGGTVLDPFAGSGTTGEAALREGFDCVLMEAEPEYVEFLLRRFPAPDWHAKALEMLA